MRLSLALAVALSLACGQQEAHVRGPVTIAVDDLHATPEDGAEGELPPPYTVPATTELRLDASTHQFFTASNYPPPDTVHVVLVSGRRQYSAVWTAPAVTLNPDTLEALDGGPPFNGFARGEHAIIAIGSLDPETENLSLRTNWIGRVLFE